MLIRPISPNSGLQFLKRIESLKKNPPFIQQQFYTHPLMGWPTVDGKVCWFAPAVYLVAPVLHDWESHQLEAERKK